MSEITFKPTKYMIDSHPIGYLEECYFLTLKKLGYNIYRDDDNEYSPCFIETLDFDKMMQDICENFNVAFTMEYPEEPYIFECSLEEAEMFTSGITTIHLETINSESPIVLDGNCEIIIKLC